MPDDNTVILDSPVSRPQPKSWRVLRTPQDRGYGVCDYADRAIEIDPAIEGRTLYDTALHESAHAALPDLCEAAIVRLVKCQMAVLTHLGLVPSEDE